MKKNAKIVLESGVILEGYFFGRKKESLGDFIFNTSVTGYEEAITDPSYNQEILVMTFPLQGIYGITKKHYQSKKVQVAGLVVGYYEPVHSNWESDYSLDSFLNDSDVPGIYGVDTRYLTKIIREQGSTKGAIVEIEANNEEIIKKLKNTKFSNHVQKIQPNTLISPKHKQGNVDLIVYNFGCKQSIVDNLALAGFNVHLVDWNTPYSEIKKIPHAGIFLSNGPGDPSELTSVITEIKNMMTNKETIVGICLGHQLISLALGAQTYRLKYGHHSINHPVKNLITDKVILTSQNHNYCVKEETLPKDVKISYVSLNDGSIEGIISKTHKISCVQFHPEANPGPEDSLSIFKDFKNFINEVK